MAIGLVDVAALLFICAVGVTVGASITIAQLQEAAQQYKSVVIGFAAQFLFMPLMAWALTHLLRLEDVAEVSGSALVFGASLVHTPNPTQPELGLS